MLVSYDYFIFLFQYKGSLSLFSNRLSPIPIIVKGHLQQGVQLLMLDDQRGKIRTRYDGVFQVNHR